MLTYLRLKNFKSFQDQVVTVSPFTILLGVNASGKSNLFDAIRFLQGVGQGYSISEVLNGRYEGGVPVWRGLRGAINEVALDKSQLVSIESHWMIGGTEFAHEICFSVKEEPRIEKEKLFETKGGYLFDTHAPSLGAGAGVGEGGAINVAFKRAIGGGRSPRTTFAADKSILSRRLSIKNIHQKVIDISEALVAELSNALFLDLQPNLMRDFRPSIVKSIGVNGENISSALFNLCKDKEKKIAIIDWIASLCAPEIEDIDFVKTEFDQVLFVLVESKKRRISAKSVSDGTLRFLGELVTLLTAQAGSLVLIEELENGLHPSRQALLVQAIEGHIEQSGLQVIASTHSPILLEALTERVLKDAIVFGRLPDDTGTIMKNLRHLQGFDASLKKRDVGDLFTTLWLERAL